MTGPPTTPDEPAAGGGAVAGGEPAAGEPPLVPVSSPRTRRVVLGIVVALVVMAAAGVALAMSTDGDGDGEQPPAAGGPGAGAPTGQAAPPGGPPVTGSVPSAGAPAGIPLPLPSQLPTTAPVPPDDAFRPVPGLCEEAHFSPLFDIVARAETLSDDEVGDSSFYQRECTFRLEEAGSSGTFRVNVAVYSSPDEARDWFDDVLTAEERGMTHEELAGDWGDNAMLAGPAPGQADVRFIARDETLLLTLRTFIVGDAADEQAQRAAVLAVADALRERLRS